MASEYKKRGGGYNTDKKDQDESQKHLSKWTEEEWQTKEGSGNAKQEDGTQKRYLPKKAWEDMNEEEKKETDEKKMEESKEGQHFVGNTAKAKGARQKANKAKSDEYDAKKAKEQEAASEQEDGDDEDNGDQEEAENDPKPGQKRSRGRPAGSSKKQKKNPDKNQKSASKSKTTGSKKDSVDAPAPQASIDRLPKAGQTVHWKALSGWVEGTVIEVAREEKEVEGKRVKAKTDDPRIVLKSKNGKVAVHKVEAVHFE